MLNVERESVSADRAATCIGVRLVYNRPHMRDNLGQYLGFRGLPRHRKFFTGLLIAGLVGTIAFFALLPVVKSVNRQRKLEILRTEDGQRAKEAAWWVTDNQRIQYAHVVREALCRPEISADFRESLVYTLGRIRDREAVPLLKARLKAEKEGNVRQATWLALARIDDSAFREAIADADEVKLDAWDQLGIAQGRLENADFRGAETAIRFARNGTEDQRVIASRALEKTVRPVLEVAGYWPIEFEPQPGDIWSDELVDIVEKRLAIVRPAQIVADTLQHQKLAAGVQRNVRRIVDGRDHIAWFLFWIRD